MPVLPLEPFVHPHDLFDYPGRLVEEEIPWHVLHVRPRAEKALGRWLYRYGVSFFLPLRERRTRVQRRLVCAHLPLFPGYLFLRGNYDARRTALVSNLVVHDVPVSDQQRLSRDLIRVFRLIQSGEPVFPEERLQPGMPAEIISGTLKGLRGIVVQRRERPTLTFIIEVDFLQQGASVQVDSSMIRPV